MALILAACLCVPAMRATAQDAGRVVISTPELDEFPIIKFYLELYRPSGEFITDLKAEEVLIQENGNTRQPSALEKVEPGLELIAAYNTTPSMANKLLGVSYFQLAQDALKAWAQSRPAEGPDTFSIATNTGMQALRLESPQAWLQALEAYQPELATAETSLVSLSVALDMASEPLAHPRQRRAILYITPAPLATMGDGIKNLADQAAQSKTPVYIWLAATGIQADNPAIQPLVELATRSGGQIINLADQPAPDLEANLQPMRYLYQLSYRSGILASGFQQVMVEVRRPDVTASSSMQSFEMEVLPPNPFFLSPPSRIERAWLKEGDEDVLLPKATDIRILVEFPDAHQRSLVRSSLFVNGSLVDENTRTPFESFTLPLERYATSGVLTLQVEVEDELGMTARSIETPVELVVAPERKSLLGELISWQRLAFAGGALLIAVLLSILLAQRIRHARRKPMPKRTLNLKTRPVSLPPSSEVSRQRAAAMAPTKERPLPELNAPARLVRLSESGLQLMDGTILIHRAETTFGTDPQRATCLIDAPSMNALHAHLARSSEGSYILTDNNTVAGTWVNYTAVPAGGQVLEHGDLVHFGRAAFRFELNNPPRVRRPTVSSYEEE